jgi:ABC-2 type transport system ATP-binding protein
MSALDMLHHLAVMKGITNKTERAQMVDALLNQTNLWDARKKALSTYSGGMKQRFGIAQALLANPKLIIVDEPTAGLDPAERNRFLNLLSSIGSNVTVILSTHIVDDVRELCPRMAIIANGELLLEGSPAIARRAQGQDLEQGRRHRRRTPRPRSQLQRHLDPSRRRPARGPHLRRRKPRRRLPPVDSGLEDVYFLNLAGQAKN